MAKKLYFAVGSICVDADGYWHSAGGAKNTFGYIPHLRSSNNYNFPVYPDTQLLNVLRVAANVYTKQLKGSTISLNYLFGKEGSDGQGLLKVGDLELADGAKWNPERFEIKPRVKINTDTHAVENKMLGFHEMANLTGYKLVAPIYVGPFKAKEQCQASQQFIDEISKYSFGLGAFKSRGCGNGIMKVEWGEVHACSTDFDVKINESEKLKYTLKAVVNFRNKDVASNTRQHISVKNCITATQIYGWFVKAYNSVFGEWPTSEEISSISFNNLYPSLGDMQNYPPPLTTKEVEPPAGGFKGKIYDFYGSQNIAKSKDEQHADVHDRVKESCLNINQYVTNTIKPQVTTCRINMRMRNSMHDNFVTRKNGLFSQDLISSGTCFSGSVYIDNPQSKFGRNALRVLSRMYVTIGGCVLTPVGLSSSEEKIETESNGHLVVTDTPFLGTVSESSLFEEGVVNFDVAKRYNTMLKRPKRNRPVFASGSVLNNKPETKTTISWNGFGHSDLECLPEEVAAISTTLNSVPEPPNKELKFPSGISRSQRGFFRGLLTPAFGLNKIKIVLGDRIAKFEKRGESENELLSVIEGLIALSEDEFKRQLKYMLEEYTLRSYEKKQLGEKQNAAG